LAGNELPQQLTFGCFEEVDAKRYHERLATLTAA
jgi:hypothetical protein